MQGSTVPARSCCRRPPDPPSRRRAAKRDRRADLPWSGLGACPCPLCSLVAESPRRALGHHQDAVAQKLSFERAAGDEQHDASVKSQKSCQQRLPTIWAASESCGACVSRPPLIKCRANKRFLAPASASFDEILMRCPRAHEINRSIGHGLQVEARWCFAPAAIEGPRLFGGRDA